MIDHDPVIEIRYTHTRDGKTVSFDTKAIREQLEGIPLNSAGAVSAIVARLNQEEETLAH